MNKELLEKKINLVMDKLINLGGADYDADKNITAKEATATGNIARDFGIEEWDWPQGIGLYGLCLLQDYYGDDRYMDFFKSWYQTNLDKGLPSKNINTTAPLLTLEHILDKMPNKDVWEDLCLDRANWLMKELPKTKEGGFQHVTSAIGDRNGIILNDSELWMDTLFMAVLFLQHMGIRYNRKDWLEEATHQVLVHIKYLYCKNNGLFYHGWSFNRNDNFGGIFWCRGNSWFTLGITLFLECADYMDKGTRQYIEETFQAHAATLKAMQGTTGLFHTILDDNTSYEEASGSAAIAAGLVRGVKLGLLPADFAAPSEKAIEALMDCVTADGTVDKVSAGTGMGYDADHYKGIQIRPMAYGQSLTLIALIEQLAALK